jgi:hypothetical protein
MRAAGGVFFPTHIGEDSPKDNNMNTSQEYKFSRLLGSQAGITAPAQTAAVTPATFDQLIFVVTLGATVDCVATLQSSEDDGTTWLDVKPYAIGAAMADQLVVLECSQANRNASDLYRLSFSPTTATDIDSVVALQSGSTDQHLPIVSADVAIVDRLHAPEGA